MDFEIMKEIVAVVFACLSLIIALLLILYFLVWTLRCSNSESDYLNSLDDDELKYIYDYRRHCRVPFFNPFNKKKEKKKE